MFDPQELNDKFVPYGFIILRGVVCTPSNLLFMSFFAPSMYESKLWDLKYYLARVHPKESLNSVERKKEYLSTELNDLKPNGKYSHCPSFFFKRILKTITDDRVSKMADDGKYLYYSKAAIDWELLHIQPLRYIWNETEQIALYALLFTAVSAASSTTVVERTINYFKATRIASLRNRYRTWLHGFAFFCKGSSLCKRVLGFAVSPIIIANYFNLGFLAGSYTKPEDKD